VIQGSQPQVSQNDCLCCRTDKSLFYDECTRSHTTVQPVTYFVSTGRGHSLILSMSVGEERVIWIFSLPWYCASLSIFGSELPEVCSQSA